MKPSTARRVIFGLVFAILLLNAVLFLATRPDKSRAPVRTGANSYPALLQAARELQDSPPADYREVKNRELLVGILRNNEEVLRKAKAALTGESWVVLSTNVDRLDDFNRFKQLARTLDCEALVATIDEQWAEAAEAGLVIVRLGHEVARGGVLIDSMVGVAIQRVGLTALPPSSKLDAKTALLVATVLADLEERRPSTREVWEQEVNWTRRVYGFKGQVVRLMTHSSLEKTRKAWAGKYNQAQHQARFALATYAVRSYELEHGKPPAGWADLVPAYLKTIPTVPVSEGQDATPAPIDFTFAPQ